MPAYATVRVQLILQSHRPASNLNLSIPGTAKIINISAMSTSSCFACTHTKSHESQPFRSIFLDRMSNVSQEVEGQVLDVDGRCPSCRMLLRRTDASSTKYKPVSAGEQETSTLLDTIQEDDFENNNSIEEERVLASHIQASGFSNLALPLRLSPKHLQSEIPAYIPSPLLTSPSGKSSKEMSLPNSSSLSSKQAGHISPYSSEGTAIIAKIRRYFCLPESVHWSNPIYSLPRSVKSDFDHGRIRVPGSVGLRFETAKTRSLSPAGEEMRLQVLEWLKAINWDFEPEDEYEDQDQDEVGSLDFDKCSDADDDEPLLVQRPDTPSWQLGSGVGEDSEEAVSVQAHKSLSRLSILDMDLEAIVHSDFYALQVRSEENLSRSWHIVEDGEVSPLEDEFRRESEDYESLPLLLEYSSKARPALSFLDTVVMKPDVAESKLAYQPRRSSPLRKEVLPMSFGA